MADTTKLVKILSFGGQSYTFDASELGGYTAEQWAQLYNIIMAADNDDVINNLTELLAIFNDYPEGANILEALNAKSAKTHTHSISSVKGTVSAPSFTGTQATISVSGTSKGTVSIGVASDGTTNYTPAGSIKDISYTPEGSITGSQTISGTSGGPSATVKVGSETHTHKVTAKGSISTSAPGTGVTPTYTPAGSVSQPSLTHTATGTTVPNSTNKSTNVASTEHTHSVTGTVAISEDTVSESTPANYTPKGNVSSSFSGTAGTVSVSGTPEGTISAPSFTGTQATIEVTGTPIGTVSSHSHTVTLKNENIGSASGWSSGSLPSITDQSTTTVNSITGVGSASKLDSSYDADTKTLTLTYTASTVPTYTGKTVVTNRGTFSAGSLPSLTVTTKSVTTGVTSVSSVAPSFTGTAFESSGTYTPAGSVSAPEFTGKSLTSTGSFTPSGSISSSFSGTGAYLTGSISGTAAKTTSAATSVASNSHTHNYDKSTSVSKPTFAGTGVMFTFTGSEATSGGPSATTSVGSNSHTHTTSHTVDFTNATFSGTAATLTTTFTGTPARFYATFTGQSHTSTATYTPAGTVSAPTFTFTSGSTSQANS